MPEQMGTSRQGEAKIKRTQNMSALGFESDRKLFLPEEINFPNQSMDIFPQPQTKNETNTSLLHQILRSSD